MRARVLVRDRGLRRASRRLADEDGTRLCEALDAGGGVDEIARDHPLALGAEGDRGLAREYGGARGERRSPELGAERGDCGNEVESRAYCSLGVVLPRGRRAPYRHDRVADELLDLAAVALDDRVRDLGVAREQVAHLLDVTLLREGRVPDEVGEEDGDEPALDAGAAVGAWLPGRRRPRARRRTLRRSARPARSPRRRRGTGPRASPALAQNFLPARFVHRTRGTRALCNLLRHRAEDKPRGAVLQAPPAQLAPCGYMPIEWYPAST